MSTSRQAEWTKKKPAKSEGQEDEPKIPQWLVDAGVKEYFTPTRDQLERLTLPTWTLKVRIWAYLIMNTVRHKGELAQRSVWIKGTKNPKQYKLVEITPSQISYDLAEITEGYYVAAGIPIKEIKKVRRTRKASLAPPRDGEPIPAVDNLRPSPQDMRRALDEMEEEDGIVERRRAKDGKLIRLLTLEEAHRLPGGAVHIYAYLIPRPAPKDKAAAEWEDVKRSVAKLPIPDDVSDSDVGNKCLRHPRISLILKVLEKEGLEKRQLSTPLYNEIVIASWEKAKKIFADEIDARMAAATCAGNFDAPENSAPSFANQDYPNGPNIFAAKSGEAHPATGKEHAPESPADDLDRTNCSTTEDSAREATITTLLRDRAQWNGFDVGINSLRQPGPQMPTFPGDGSPTLPSPAETSVFIRGNHSLLSSSHATADSPVPAPTTTIPGPPTPDTEDADPIGKAAAQYVMVDDRWVADTVRKCRAQAAEVGIDPPPRIAELVRLANEKGRAAQRNGDNPAGYLQKSMINACAGKTSFDLMRIRLQSAESIFALKDAEAEDSHQRFEADQAFDQQVEEAWVRLDPADKAQRIDRARQKLKTEARWGRIPKDIQQRESELQARNALKREMEVAS